MKNADEPEVDQPPVLPDVAHEAWFLSDNNLPFMGNVTRRQSRFVWRAARRDADAEIERLRSALIELTRIDPPEHVRANVRRVVYGTAARDYATRTLTPDTELKGRGA